MSLVDKMLHFNLLSHDISLDLYFPGCYEKAVTYSYPDGDTMVPVPMSQIESLIQLSEFCDQEFQYDCTLAPLTTEDIDFAFWEDRAGGMNNYFTGAVKISAQESF